MTAPVMPTAAGGSNPLSGEARAAARGVVALTVLQTLGRVFGLSFALGATRILVPSQLGRYSTVSGIVLFGGFLADFGTSIAITRWISRDPEATDEVLGGTLGLSLGIGLVTYAAALGFAQVAGYPAATVRDIAIGGLALPASAVATSLLAALDGRGMLDRRAAITFVQSALVGLGGLIALALSGTVRSAVAMIPAGPLVGGLLAIVVLRRSGVWRSRISFDPSASKRLLLDALPLAALAGIAAFVARFDLVFVSVVSDAAETARYDLALRSVEALTYLGSVIAAPAIFILTRRLSRGDAQGAQRALEEGARFSYIVGLPLSVVLAAGSEAAVLVLYGPRYTNVSMPLAVLAAALWLGLLVSLLGSAILASGLGRAVIPVSAAVALVGIALDVALVPTWGASGAALAAAGGQAAGVAGFAWFARRRTGLRLVAPAPGVVVAAAAGGVTTVVGRSTLGVGALALGIAVYAVCLVAFRGVGRDDLGIVRAALRPAAARELGLDG